MVAKSRRALFPGTFDPITNGHLDIIRRSLSIVDELIVAVLQNSQKAALFSVAERIELIEGEVKQFSGKVLVRSFSGLLVDFAKNENCMTVIRGLRAISDYDYEAQMALMNKNLNPSIETVFLIAREENSYISSSIVKEAALLGGDISKFVPANIQKAIVRKVTAL